MQGKMMHNATVKLLAGKKYLLLQGPMGPFFNDVANWLETLEREAVNVVFNGGDRFYCRQRNHLTYQQTPQEFPGWLKKPGSPTLSIRFFASATAAHFIRPLAHGRRQKASVFLPSKKGTCDRTLLPLRKMALTPSHLCHEILTFIAHCLIYPRRFSL
jgi:hypothetical protein